MVEVRLEAKIAVGRSGFRFPGGIKLNSGETSRDCPLCASSSWKIIARGHAEQIVRASPYYDQSSYSKLGIAPTTAFTLSRCRSCHFVYSSHVPSEAFLDRLYSDQGDLEQSVRVFSRPGRAAAAFRSLSDLLGEIANRRETDHRGVTDRPVRILDIGCAYGVGTLGLVHPHYPYEVVGVDSSKLAREYVSAQGMQSYRSLNELIDVEPFDGILLNDVLEHVGDPVMFMNDVKNLTHSRTAIWVNVPNYIDWRLSEILQSVNSGATSIPTDLNPWEHLSYFSPSTLNALMEKVGARRLRAVNIDYPVNCDSLKDFLVSITRACRDFFWIYSGKYPDQISTSGIFVFADQG